MKLEELLRLKRVIKVIGFDDAPFVRQQPHKVPVAGIICGITRFEGMLWGQIEPDGWDATEVISTMLLESKFHTQLDLVLIDGLGFGGFNLVDLPELATKLDLPCVAVMRHMPNLTKIAEALNRLSEPQRRLELVKRAGEVYNYPPFYFQVCGEKPEVIARCLAYLSDRGKVPEALRLAHLITAAVVTGSSGKRA